VKRSVGVLLFALLIQCGITAILFWPDQRAVNRPTNPTLTSFSSDEIDEIRIGDDFDNEVVLIRSSEQWLLPDLGDLPADSVKVRSLLQRISGEQGAWPIAHSSAARQRFQVADYYYQRRLTLFSAGQALDTLYLGTSPRFRKVHARNDRQDAIYSITLSAFETPATSGAWLEPRLLQVRAPLRIDTGFYNLSFESGRWLSGTGREPNEMQLERLISALKSLQIDGIAGEELQHELSMVKADLVMKIQSPTGNVTLELISVTNEHFIYSSEYPIFFTLSAYDFDRLTGVDPRLISGEKGGI
jgi:hypothetical protein